MRSITVLLVVFLFAVAALAQSDRGTITGTVGDPAGAVVAEAVIEARNVETGAVYPGASTASGNYTLTQLPVGAYELSVSVPGFKKFIRQNIAIQVAETLRIDVTLEVGATSESVTVSSEVSLLKTESGELSHHIDHLERLPVFGVGASNAGSSGIRNPYAVTQLIPGTYWSPNNTVRLNGAPGNSQSLRIEGQDATLGFANWAAQESQPGVDAIQEFAIQTSNYAAEFGQAGGGLFNLTMKSGGNQFHGSAYDYFVNEALNAGQPWTTSPKGLLRPVARRNDYGFTLGGPVWLPKVYNGHDKTFFFFTWEQFRETQNINTQSLTVPTVAYRNGDFSQAIPPNAGNLGNDPLGRPIIEGTIYNPLTEKTVGGQVVRDPFLNNTIPTGQLDKVALAIQAKIPQPGNSGLINNLILPYPSQRVTSIPTVKVDHSLGSRSKFSFYYQRTSTTSQYSPTLGQSEGLPVPITAARGTFITSHIERLNYDHTLSPTLLLHVGVGYQHNFFNDNAPVLNFDPVKDLGILGPTTPRNFPTFLGTCPAGAPGTCTGRGGMVNMGPNGQTTSLMIKPTANVSVTWVKQNHTYKFGAEGRTEGYPNINDARIDGNYTFAANETALPYLNTATVGGRTIGFAYASFLLGAVDNANVAAVSNPRLGKSQWAVFAQDTWKVTRKLTFDYGLRWDYGTYQREQYGRFPSFSSTTPNPSAGGHLGGVIFEGNGPGLCNCSFAKNYPYAIGPRLGMAFQINSKTVLRAGWGISYSITPTNNQISGSASSQNPIVNPVFGEAAMTLGTGIPRTAQQIAWPSYSAGLYPLAGSTSIANFPTFLVDQNSGRPARQVMWSIGLQRELAQNLVVEASYVGNRGAWWQANLLVDYNALTPQILAANGLDLNNAADRTLLLLPLNQQTRFKSPYTGFPAGATVAQSLRPYPQFLNVPATWAPLGDTWYDSLQAKVTKRLSHGFDFTYTFTWQKELTLGAEADPPGPGAPPGSVNDVFNRSQNKSLSGYSRPFVGVLAANYTVPKWGGNKALSWGLRDWQIGVALQYASGLPIHVPYAQNNLNTLLLRNLPLGITALSYANRIPDQALFTKDINCHCFDPNSTFILNPSAWQDPAPGQWGNSAPYYNDYRYERRPNESMSLGRLFRIRERASISIRAEFSNIFNRAEMSNPSGTNAKLLQTASGGKNTAGFGWINTATVAAQPRQGTIVARFTF